MKAFFKTYGCRVNQYETQALRERLTQNRFAEVSDDFEDADLCVINTCTVTEEADQDALRLIRKINRRNPSAKLIVTGCLAERDPTAIQSAAPGALIVGNQDKKNIPSLIGCSSAPDFSSITDFWGHSRAFVKIQDGCDMGCSFCIIPSIRPNLSSRPFEEISSEIQGLLKNRCPEIVLCGIRLGRYLSKDSASRRVDFVGLLERLLELPGDFRIRLSSLEITDVTDRFIALLARSGGKIAPSLHLPLQSGSDKTLKEMRRWYTTGFYRRRLEALREKVPQCAVFSDLMAGFPGESEADFEESLRFIADMKFSGLHPFRYSSRPGTAAEKRADHLPEKTILSRAESLRALDRQLRTDFASHSVGNISRVVVEGRPGKPEGLCENFLSVSLDHYPGPGFAWVRIHSSKDLDAFAEVLPQRARENFPIVR